MGASTSQSVLMPSLIHGLNSVLANRASERAELPRSVATYERPARMARHSAVVGANSCNWLALSLMSALSCSWYCGDALICVSTLSAAMQRFGVSGVAQRSRGNAPETGAERVGGAQWPWFVTQFAAL